MRIATILLLLPVLTIHAQEPTRLPLPADLPQKEVVWYGVYIQGKKAGWAKEVFENSAAGFRIAFRMRMELQTMGEKMVIAMTQTTTFDKTAPHALLSATQDTLMGPTRMRVKIIRHEKGYRANVTSDAGDRTLEMGALDYTLADPLTPTVWLRNGPKEGDEIHVRELDLDKLSIKAESIRIEKIRRGIIGGVKTRYFEGKMTSDGTTVDFRADAAGQVIQVTMGGFMEIRQESEERAKKIEETGDLFVTGAVRIEKDLGHPAGVEELVVEVSGKGVDLLTEGPRQTLSEGTQPGTRILKIGKGHHKRFPAKEDEIKEALARTLTYPARHERIIALAKRAIGDAGNDTEKVRRMLEFVSDYIEDVYGVEHMTALQILATKKGDCSAHAMLFVALARATGIPSREVGGYMYMGDELKAFGGHAWCEVVLDGHWVEVDPTWNQMAPDATHITFDRGNAGGDAHLRTFGRLEFKILSVKQKEKVAGPTPPADDG